MNISRRALWKVRLFATLTVSSFTLTQAIDFTPAYTNSVEDGFAVRRMYFRDGSTKIFLRPPANGEFVTTPAGLTARLRALPDARFAIENSPVGEKVAFDEKGLETYRSSATTLIPKDATAAEMLSENPNALPINDWKAYEVRHSYILRGAVYHQSAMFINIGKGRQILCTAISRKKDFEAVYRNLQLVLNSWSEK